MIERTYLLDGPESSSDRILAACCSESAIDVFSHAALVTEIVAAAHAKDLRGPPPPEHLIRNKEARL